MSIFLDKSIVNGTSWALMISLDLEVISEYGYRFKKMRIQTELLDLLRDLPVCVGLGVKGDMHKIEQFYIEVSGINLEMAGFIDLSALASIAGYQNPEKISSFLDRLAIDPKWPSRTKSNKKRPRVAS